MNLVNKTLQRSWKISGKKMMKKKEELLPSRRNFKTGKDSTREMLLRMSEPKYLNYSKRIMIRKSLGLLKLTLMTNVYESIYLSIISLTAHY